MKSKHRTRKWKGKIDVKTKWRPWGSSFLPKAIPVPPTLQPRRFLNQQDLWLATWPKAPQSKHHQGTAKLASQWGFAAWWPPQQFCRSSWQLNKPSSKCQSADEETLLIGEREKNESAEVEANVFGSRTPETHKKSKPGLWFLGWKKATIKTQSQEVQQRLAVSTKANFEYIFARKHQISS